ncbi:MAG: hypothetical protein RIR00_873 [Pseudomonadota bacterium]|jgi:hypothetical protein
MELTLGTGNIEVLAGQVIRLKRARGLSLHCRCGALWLTISGQPGDFLLRAGQSLRVESQGLVLIEGFPAGALCLLPAAVTFRCTPLAMAT